MSQTVLLCIKAPQEVYGCPWATVLGIMRSGLSALSMCLFGTLEFESSGEDRCGYRRHKHLLLPR